MPSGASCGDPMSRSDPIDPAVTRPSEHRVEGFDPLLECLLAMARAHGRPATADTLMAGLPLANALLTPEMFPRAAARAGLAAKLVTRALPALTNLVLPAVLVLKGGGALVLLERIDEKRVRVLQPESGGEVALSVEALAEAYDGRVIFVRPEARFDIRSGQSTLPRARHWFWGTFASSWPIYSEVLVASLLINLFALAMPLFTMNVYDRVVPNRVMETLWALSIGLLIVFVFEFVIRSLRAYFVDNAGKRIDLVLSATIFEKVMAIRMEARPPSVGAFASQLSDFEAFREFITSTTITALVDIPFVLIFVVALFWIGGDLGWIAVVAIPIVILTSLAIQQSMRGLVEATQRLSAQRQATLVESLVGTETIRVIGASGPLQLRWEQVVGSLGRLALRSRILSMTAVNVATFSTQLSSLLVIVFGVYLMESESLTTGSLVACAILIGRALAPLGQIAQMLTRYHQSFSALRQIDHLMKLPVERSEDKTFLSRPPLRGAIEFRDMVFTYPNREAPALDKINLRIEAGERVGIIGKIGSGKSTLEKLILGLYEPTEGSILLDGTELRQLDPAAVRRHIGHVPQDVMLFFGSLRENITFGAPHADDAAILRAVKLSGLDEFTERSPQGLDLKVGERGEGLSGGQRQAVAIARAEILAPPILLLDEPTSAMDSGSEEKFKRRLEASLDGRTLLLVTHRYSLLSLVQRLVVIDGGRIVADGPRDTVLAALAGRKVHGAAP